MRLHARLRDEAAAVFRALDQSDGELATLFVRFVDDIERHVSVDLAVGYRLLLNHPNESVRRIAERVLDNHAAFPQAFDAFAARYRRPSEATLRSLGFRDDLESLATALLKRIRIEERLVEILSHVA